VLKYDVEMDRPVRTYLFTLIHLGSQFIQDFLIEILVTVHYFNHFTTLNTIMWTLPHLSNHIYKFDFFFYLGIYFFLVLQNLSIDICARCSQEKFIDKSFIQRTKDLDTVEILEQLPALQQLLFRILGCQVSDLLNSMHRYKGFSI
jgi:hypothetical protein